LAIVLGVVAVVALGTWLWRRREGRFDEASGRFDGAELGIAGARRASAVVVEFGGEHCGSCRIVEQRLAKLSNEIPDVRVVTLDVEDNEALAERYGVTRVPTLFVTDPELRIRWRASGVPSEDAVRTALLGPEWAGRPQPSKRKLVRLPGARRKPRTITLHDEGVACEVAPSDRR
jgi:thiol-disulfide isomerase/thioredoxin